MSTLSYDKIIKFLIKALIFVLPVFWLPWTYEFFEFNKGILLLMIAPLIFFIWLFAALKNRELKIKRSPLDIPIIVFILATLISSLFSIDKFSSFFGYHGNSSFAWFAFAASAVFYFTVVNFAKKDILNIFCLLKLLIYSYALALFSSFLAMAGIFRKLTGANNILSSPSFNFFSGSLESLAVYSAVISSLILGLIFFYYSGKEGLDSKEKKEQIFFKFILVLACVFSVMIIPKIWLIFLLQIILIVFVELILQRGKNFRKKIKSLIIPSIFLLCLSFIAFFSNDIISNSLPREASLSHDFAFKIIEKVDGKILLGNGLGTFSYVASRYRPAEVNQFDFWNVRFDKNPSYFLELFSSCGIIGILSYILIVIVLALLIFIFLKKIRERDIFSENTETSLIPALIMALTALLLTHILYNSNIVLTWTFFLFSALLVVALRHSGLMGNLFRSVKIKNIKASLPISFILLTCWALFAGFGIRFWIADFNFRNGGETGLIKAIELNPNRVEYKIALAKYYLREAKNEASKPANEINLDILKSDIEGAINWARQAVNKNPNLVASHETLGMIYRDTRGFTKGSEQLTINSFSDALALEPNNPVLLTELAKAHLNAGNGIKAQELLNEAIRLKPDYYEAQFALARTYSELKKDSAALRTLENLINVHPQEEIYYEYGRELYNAGDIEKAKEQFIKALEINPKNSNALYSLALSFETTGQVQEALNYFNKVLELNPGNGEVSERIKRLVE